MKTFGNTEIRVTGAQLARTRALVQATMRETACCAWAGDDDGLDYVFGKALGWALGGLGVALEYESVPYTSTQAHTVCVTDAEAIELEKLQETVWRKGIGEGRALSAVVDEIFDASVGFLGIKVGGSAAHERGRDGLQLRGAWGNEKDSRPCVRPLRWLVKGGEARGKPVPSPIFATQTPLWRVDSPGRSPAPRRKRQPAPAGVSRACDHLPEGSTVTSSPSARPRFPAFRPRAAVRGVFGAPKAHIVRLERREKTVCGVCGRASRRIYDRKAPCT